MLEENDDVTGETSDENTVNEMNELKAELAQMRQTNQQILASLQPRQPEPEAISREEVARIKDDPELLAKWIEDKVTGAQRKVQANATKDVADRKAYEDFPALKTNKKFQQAAVAKMNELIGNGEYAQGSPLLLLRAAQLVAPMFQQRVTEETEERPTSGESRPRPVSKSSGTSHIKDNDPRVAFLKLMDPALAKNPAKLEAFKKGLKPYVRPTESRARSLDRGDD